MRYSRLLFQRLSKDLSKKFIQVETLEEWSKELKAKGHSLVTINGSFDLLHAGHLHILVEASAQGDKLLVALNTDNSIKRYKGSTRPIISLHDRLILMAALECVDFVTYFDEDDPCELLQKVKPHVHANGSEYGANCIEADTVISNGGKIHIIPLVKGLSTSRIIKKIKEECA